jgi:hypothetical protein
MTDLDIEFDLDDFFNDNKNNDNNDNNDNNNNDNDINMQDEQNSEQKQPINLYEPVRKPCYTQYLDLMTEKVLAHLSSSCPNVNHQKQYVKQLYEKPLMWFILTVYGKRWFSKQTLQKHQLTREEMLCFADIKQKMQNPIRRERIIQMIQKKDASKRLFHYFAAHYLLNNHVHYWLDKTEYPYKIIGKINDHESSPEIQQAYQQGRKLSLIQLVYEYKNLKSPVPGMCMNAPYQRSTTVYDESTDDKKISLCQFRFFLWLDSVGGMDAFHLLEDDIRKQKKSHDLHEHQRHCEEEQKQMKSKKSKDKLKYKTPLAFQQTPYYFLSRSNQDSEDEEMETFETWLDRNRETTNTNHEQKKDSVIVKKPNTTTSYQKVKKKNPARKNPLEKTKTKKKKNKSPKSNNNHNQLESSSSSSSSSSVSVSLLDGGQ